MAEKKKNLKSEKKKSKNVVATRGRTFKGEVVGKFPKRIVIEFERTVFVQKFERFMKKRTRVHARLPDEMNVNIGDTILVRECRPLSKIIHFLAVEKIREAGGKDERN